MPRPPKKIKKILDGKVSLYQKPNETIWQYSFFLNDQHLRKTTKTRDFDEAVSVATEAYIEARALTKAGIPIVTRTFSSVAELAIKQMEDAKNAGMGKVVFDDYIGVLRRYFIPYFGAKHIGNITHQELSAFSAWRREQLSRNPSRSTITTHNSALNRVFDAALERGFITKSSIPDLKNDGESQDRRPDFTPDEIAKLIKYTAEWSLKGKQGLITNKRLILRDYIDFVLKTGVRPGTETLGLKWCHFRYEEIGRVPYLHIAVAGKTGRREIIAKHSIIRCLARLAARNENLAGLTIGEVIEQKKDEFVFALPDGTEVSDLIRPFKQLMKDSGLLIDPRTGDERVLYSLRHTYITRAVYNGATSAEIATQCGTSSEMIDKFYLHKNPSASAKAIVLGRRV